MHIDIDNDRSVSLRKDGDTFQVKFSRSGTDPEGRCSVKHTPCRCGKGRTTVHLGMSEEALQALACMYLLGKPVHFVEELITNVLNTRQDLETE